MKILRNEIQINKLFSVFGGEVVLFAKIILYFPRSVFHLCCVVHFVEKEQITNLQRINSTCILKVRQVTLFHFPHTLLQNGDLFEWKLSEFRLKGVISNFRVRSRQVSWKKVNRCHFLCLPVVHYFGMHTQFGKRHPLFLWLSKPSQCHRRWRLLSSKWQEKGPPQPLYKSFES